MRIDFKAVVFIRANPGKKETTDRSGSHGNFIQKQCTFPEVVSIHCLTTRESVELRIDLQDEQGNKLTSPKMVRDQYQVMGLVIPPPPPPPPKLILTDLMYTLTVMFIVVSLAVVSGLGTTSYGELKFLVTCHFFGTEHFQKSAPIPKENACKSDLSMVSFLPGLALMKTTVLESMRTLSYFRLDTLPMVRIQFPVNMKVPTEQE